MIGCTSSWVFPSPIIECLAKMTSNALKWQQKLKSHNGKDSANHHLQKHQRWSKMTSYSQKTFDQSQANQQETPVKHHCSKNSTFTESVNLPRNTSIGRPKRNGVRLWTDEQNCSFQVWWSSTVHQMTPRYGQYDQMTPRYGSQATVHWRKWSMVTQIMVWGWFSYDCVGHIYLIPGIMDQFEYIKILGDYVAVCRKGNTHFRGVSTRAQTHKWATSWP